VRGGLLHVGPRVWRGPTTLPRMNRWTCELHGCDSTAVGDGGAIGLRAIGWYFVPGGRLLCPVHRPDPIECEQPYNEGNAGKPCRLCSAEAEARILQDMINDRLSLA